MYPVQRSSLALLMSLSAALAGCGGGGDSDSTAESGSTTSGRLSLAITDAPVDSASSVVVEFTGVSIKPTDGEHLEFNFDSPQSIDLLTLQGNASEPLLVNEEVPAGEYEWVRLHVNAEEDGVADSYIEMTNGTQLELRVPSGSETGLKLVSGFTVAAGGTTDFTIDFDLRKSITNPVGQAHVILKPVLRLVNNVEVGGVSGAVDPTLVSQACADASIDDGAVYAFSGAEVTPADVQGRESDPVATALVSFEEQAYRYELGFLVEGDYTLAYTCEASLDEPEAVNAIVFASTATVSVTAGEQATQNFTVEAESEAAAGTAAQQD